MLWLTLMIASLSSGPAPMGLSLTRVAENWVSTRHTYFQNIHLASVKTHDGVICAVDYHNDDYLIDPRLQITWVDSLAYQHFRFDPKSPNSHIFYYMDQSRKKQWALCERLGVRRG